MGRTYELIIKDTNKPTKLVDLKIDVKVSGYLSRYDALTFILNRLQGTLLVSPQATSVSRERLLCSLLVPQSFSPFLLYLFTENIILFRFS